MARAETAETKVEKMEEDVRALEYSLQPAKIAEQRAEEGWRGLEEQLKMATDETDKTDKVERAEQTCPVSAAEFSVRTGEDLAAAAKAAAEESDRKYIELSNHMALVEMEKEKL